MEIKFSIVIPNYNGRKLLEKNLPAVLQACQNWSKSSAVGSPRGEAGGWEIVVVDDASTDDSVGFLQKNYPQIKIVEHKKNQRFAENCNSGVKAAKGGIVVLLNNDVAPEADFLEPLIRHFQDPKVFAVGCLEKDEQKGKIILSGRSEGKFQRGFLVHWRAKDQNQNETLWATGGSLAADREKWLKLGGMDDLFRPAYWEDIDLSWRARKAGWKIIFEPNSIVNHKHETTNLSVFGRKKMKKSAYKNQFLFVWKNAGFGLLIQHLIWLPFHLLKAVLVGDWLFLRGFFQALKQTPELI